MIYYFAYGSNLDEEQMKKRCPDSQLLGVAVLKNYRLDFTIYSKQRKCGCADIIKHAGKEVWGLIYILSKEDLEKLDEFEGHPNHYQRIEADVTRKKGDLLKVFMYEVVGKLSFQVPSLQYLDIIKAASYKFDFPSDYKDFLDTIKYTS